jgi:hypothetical protein
VSNPAGHQTARRALGDVKKRGEISLSGLAFPDPDNQCTYQAVRYFFFTVQFHLLRTDVRSP